jgi:ATP-dependent DNA ligase
MPRLGIMLAYPFEEKRLLTWNPPYIVQPKLDGNRCRAVFDEKGNVVLYSSEMNIIKDVPHINKELLSLGYKDIELDGELYSHGTDHASIHGIVSSTRVEESPDSEIISFNVFDVVSSDIQALRLRALNMLLPDDMDYIKRVPFNIAENKEDIINLLHKYTDQGYEGIVIRNKFNRYERRRSTMMMKFKPKRSDAYQIIGYVEEQNHPGNLGAFTCRGDDLEEFNVGSGFDAKQRMEYWKQREDLIGKFVKVNYQHLTKARGVPREGIFVEILEQSEYKNLDFQEVPEL